MVNHVCLSIHLCRWLATQQELGDVFIMSMGPFPQLVVADPQFSHDIFTSCAQYYHKTSEQNKKLVRPLLGNGLLLSEGKYWEKQRAFVEPSFHWKKLATMIDSLAACSDDAIRKMVQPPPLTAEASELHKAPPPPGAEKAVELHASIVGFSFDVIARVAFGTSFGNQPGTTARFIDAMHHMLRSVKDRVLITMVPIISDIPFPSLKRMRKACATVHDIVRDVVSSRTQAGKQSQEGKESTDVLNILLGACKALPDGSFCEEDAKMLQEESVNFIAAASETTSNVLTWLVYKLVQDAQLWAQVSSEVQRVCPHGKIPTYDDLKALVFLEACIYETQRLFSPVPIIMKLAVEDHTVVWRKTDSMGLPCPVKVLIPAGTNVCIHADLIHRHAKYWPNPFTFDPTRFLAPIDGGGDALKRGEGSAFAQNVPHPFSFLGFAAGPRKCLGKNLAILEIKTFVGELPSFLSFLASCA